jgi:hypothetical protein
LRPQAWGVARVLLRAEGKGSLAILQPGLAQRKLWALMRPFSSLLSNDWWVHAYVMTQLSVGLTIGVRGATGLANGKGV